MSNNTKSPWNPPSDLSVLNFSDCALAADWAAKTLKMSDLPINATIKLLRNALEEYFRHSSMDMDQIEPEMLAWFSKEPFPLEQLTIYGEPEYEDLLPIKVGVLKQATACEELCPLLGWQGNADLSGRGVGPQFPKSISWLTFVSDVM